jgi:hypothetical protein
VKAKRDEAYARRDQRAFKRLDDEMFVDLSIYDVPAGLLRESSEKVVRSSHLTGVNEAIKDYNEKP